jgi:hypothetical protein
MIGTDQGLEGLHDDGTGQLSGGVAAHAVRHQKNGRFGKQRILVVPPRAGFGG